MENFIDSCLLGDLARTLRMDLTQAPAENAPFACRPLAAHTAERNTALGRFVGRISLQEVQEFRAALDDMVTDSLSKAILDLGAVSLSKSAVGMLVGFAAAMHGRNKKLYLYRPSAQVRAVLKELGLTRFFTYLETEDDVIATLVV